VSVLQGRVSAQDCNLCQSNKMEKEVENPSLSPPQKFIKDKSGHDDLELARLFQQMTVRTSKGQWRGENQNDLVRLKKQEKFKKPEKKKRRKVHLKPSQLIVSPSNKPEKSEISEVSAETGDNFSDFLTACSREIATIEESEQKKQRKSSSCAQQARLEEHEHAAAVDFSIDVLTDYFEETVLLPKKMSYMAELMYT